VLGVIGFFPGRTPTELAATLGMPPTTISRHVARLADGGLVERDPHPEDGRSYLLRPTEAGTTVVQTIAPRIAELVGALRTASEQPLAEIAAALRALEAAARTVAAERQ
jgi:DNA-binding MarR family transcriptional regulator